MSTINKIKKDGILYDIEDKTAREELQKIPTNFVTEESDPTVPDFVKNITEEDIANWNKILEGGGSSDSGITVLESTLYNGWDLAEGVYILKKDTQILYNQSKQPSKFGGIMIIQKQVNSNKFVAFNGYRFYYGTFNASSGESNMVYYFKLLTSDTGATQQYVDDSIATAITGTLGGSY